MTSLFNLTGKAALGTGGNGGIGLGIARGLAHAGARVAIIARNTVKSHAAAKALAQETGVAPLVLSADVPSPDQVAAVVNEANNGLGRIDILFNNAGISIRKLPQDLPKRVYDGQRNLLTSEGWRGKHSVGCGWLCFLDKAGPENALRNGE